MSDNIRVTLGAALDGLAARQRVIADNIANVQTPGYLAGRVDFESALRDALANGQSTRVSPTSSRSTDPTRTDGNNVNLDTETIAMVETGLRYQFAVSVLSGKYASLRTAIKGGGA